MSSVKMLAHMAFDAAKRQLLMSLSIKMLAEKNEAIDDAATTVYQLSEDERIRLQCQAREDYERDQRTVQHYIEMQTKALEEKDTAIAEQASLIAKYEAKYGKL